MNEIFRFLFLRPPAPGAAVTVRPSQGFANALTSASGSSDRTKALKTAAEQLMASGRALTDITQLDLGDKLLNVLRTLESLVDPGPPDVAKAVKDAFGKTPLQVTKVAEFGRDRDRLADNLIAAKLLSRDGAIEARRLEELLRVVDLIARAAAGGTALAEAGAVRRALTAPTLIGAADAMPSRAWPPKEDLPEPPKTIDLGALKDKIKTLEAVAATLARVPPTSFVVPQAPVVVPFPETKANPLAVLWGRLAEHIRAGSTHRPDSAIPALVAELRAVQVTAPPPPPAQIPTVRLLLTPKAADELPEQHQKALRSLGLDLGKHPLPLVLRQVTQALSGFNVELAQATTTLSGKFTLLGSQFFSIDSLIGSFPILGLPPSVPGSHGSIKPVGVGDLLVVRQQIKRYEGGEVGYIENILKGEFKKRQVRRARTTEQTTITEVETKKDEERDNQTTERFELQREASNVVKDDSSFKAGLSVSGSYGPTVEFKASTDFAMNQSKEEAAKTASSYSKEVTSRAATKVSERKREEQILRTLETFEELDKHGVDNKAGAGDVIGVYQWVDKIYEAQVFNYGKRMMFDIMVPEPAAFWIYVNSNKPKPRPTLNEPSPFTLQPTDLNAGNFAQYVKLYEVSGAKPPPDPYVTAAKTFEGTVSRDDFGTTTKVIELPLPDGYQALAGHAIAKGTGWLDYPDWFIIVNLGNGTWARNATSGDNHQYTLDGEIGAVAAGILTYGVHGWITTIEVDCQLTDRTYAAWQLDTHTAIQQGYLKLLRDYRDSLAAAEVQAAIQVQGRNPDENRMIERTELKKQAISIFTAQQFDLFGAITVSKQGYPQPWLTEAEAEGRYIRFFEQAFEWEHMTYLFYPYFWGRKQNWPARALLQDVDFQFAEFLKAGSARLVVPVRPGFEAAIAHFMDTGEIWDGADPPTLTSPLYVSIIDEIKERTQAPGTEIAQGDPWDVRLPTTLVKLREDGALPAWTKQPDGTWLPS